MKKVINYFIFSAVLALSFVTNPSFSQAKEDVIFMKNGDKKTGKVISVNSNAIRFTYSNETAVYEFDKSEVNKIEFASGRTEIFDQQSNNTSTAAQDKSIGTVATTAEERKDKIAVLPFEIQTNDQSFSTATMSKQVQESCINALKAQSPYQTIQDPMITNNILAKKNLTSNDLSMFTPREWAELLGVEYVVIGSYSIENKGTSTYGSGSANYNEKTKYDSKSNSDKTKGTTFGSSSTYTTVNYDTHVNVSIYNDQGEQVFSDTREPIFGGIDSYKSALKTLMKRSPFGRK